MSASERDFSNYQLGDNPYALADGLLPEMARALGYDLGVTPTEDALSRFIGHIGPAKELQQNIGLVQERLGSSADARTLAADWTNRSGVLLPVHRSFAALEVRTPSEFDTAYFSGGVGRWIMRRAEQTRRLADVSEIRFGEVVVAMGSRQMKESEHSLVGQLASRLGRLPTEAEFGREMIVPQLEGSGLRARLVAIESSNGDEITREAAAAIGGNGTVLSIGNAPAAIQLAGQYRLGARQEFADFDGSGAQLFMSADSLPLGRYGEPAATHQNPYTALGQIARNALFLQRNGEQ